MFESDQPIRDAPFLCENCGEALLANPAGVCARCLLRDIRAEFCDPEALLAGARFAAFELIEVINRGGMGVVFRARQEVPRREVALKVLAAGGYGSDARRRFCHETQVLAELDHPSILPIFDAGEENGRPWFTMKLALGGSLSQAAAEFHRQWRRIARLMITIAEAVHYAHQRGVTHRDLKPSNILFDEHGQAFVADFGLAGWTNPEHNQGWTLSNAVLGSPAYIAPEVAVEGSRNATILSDVYALGAMLYELLTGGPPFRGVNAALVLRDVVQEEPTSPASLDRAMPKDLSTIALKALAKDPELRYDSAAALAVELRRWLEGKPIRARPIGLTKKLWMCARRHPLPTALSLTLMAATVASALALNNAHHQVFVANKEAQSARSGSTADARAASMFTALPELLQPVGRLDLLDGIFPDVISYYESVPAADQDSAGLTRRALLLDRWSDVLSKRGLREDGIAFLRRAVETADQSLTKPDPPIDSWLAAASVRSAYAEMLVGLDRSEEADRSLATASNLVKQAQRRFQDDERLVLAQAELERRYVDTLQARQHHREALAKARELASTWRSLADRISPAKRFDRALVQRCRKGCQALFFSWHLAAMRADEHEEAVSVLSVRRAA